MQKRITYPVTAQSPLYPGTPPVTFQLHRSLKNGDSANTSLITLSSHSGSHIDMPRHFCQDGIPARDAIKDIAELEPVYCLDINPGSKQAIRQSHIEPFENEIRDAAGILVRTGMFRFRDSDPEKYCHSHPWIHPEIPGYLRSFLPDIRLFGCDTISIANPGFRKEGRECHRAFLCGDWPVLLAEDLDLADPGLTLGPLAITICPWIIDELDGIPIHAFAELIRDRGKTKNDKETGP